MLALKRGLAPAVALLALAACDTTPPEPAAAPRWTAPRDWAAAHGKETGAPTPNTPKQQAANQGGPR